MSNYSTYAIPETVVDEVRTTRESPRYRYPAYVEVSTGYGPCRYCLRTFEEGADRSILITSDPFDGLESLPLLSPIFIREAACNRYPVDGGFPDDLRFLSLTLNGYGNSRRLYAQEDITEGIVEPVKLGRGISRCGLFGDEPFYKEYRVTHNGRLFWLFRRRLFLEPTLRRTP